MKTDIRTLRQALAEFERPAIAATVIQLTTTLSLFAGACALMYWSLQAGYLLTLALSLPAGVLLVRVFIIQHDCGHGSYFRSARLNNYIGMLCGVLTMTPYGNWRRQHSGHHAVWNDLSNRRSGADIYSTCLTVAEYRALSPMRRWLHRLVRHPVIAHILLPPLIFLVLYRVPFDTPPDWPAERRAVHLNNALIAAVIGVMGLTIGFMPVLMVQGPVMSVAAIIGVWLFAVQHRYEGSRWFTRENWNFTDTALSGSSYLRLPKILQWCTGNIGFHHIHHLAPGIPNYRLESCQRAIPALQQVKPLGFMTALDSTGYALWDESARLVRFKDVRIARESKRGSETPAANIAI